jgi:hypothetical protein
LGCWCSQVELIGNFEDIKRQIPEKPPEKNQNRQSAPNLWRESEHGQRLDAQRFRELLQKNIQKKWSKKDKKQIALHGLNNFEVHQVVERPRRATAGAVETGYLMEEAGWEMKLLGRVKMQKDTQRKSWNCAKIEGHSEHVALHQSSQHLFNDCC